MNTTTEQLGLKEAKEIGRICSCFNLRKATRAVTKLYDEALRPVELRATQFTLLVGVRVREPATIQQLAAVLGMDRTTLSRNLRPLERKGLVRVVTADDRRSREVLMTAAGQAVLARAYPLWREVQGRIANRLGAAGLESLLASLGTIGEAAGTS